MRNFDELMQKVRALTVWYNEQLQNPLLTNAEVTERENQVRAQLPADVVLLYDPRTQSYGVFPVPLAL